VVRKGCAHGQARGCVKRGAGGQARGCVKREAGGQARGRTRHSSSSLSSSSSADMHSTWSLSKLNAPKLITNVLSEFLHLITTWVGKNTRVAVSNKNTLFFNIKKHVFFYMFFCF
jgi:hypothetical protein